MGFTLRITLRTEKKLVVLTAPPVDHWCEACGAESSFVDEDREAASLNALAPGTAHRLMVGERGYLCLRSIADES